ncbi:MAG: response regulator [Acidisphaera sp.]|nr:response regulator [Acidisphaera sp.]
MQRPGPRLLIVEDEFLIRLTLATALAEDGFQVSEAASGEEALALLAAVEPIDLLLTDIQLSGALDGLALARAARRQAPDLPVIFMTGRPELAREAGSANDAFVAKPYLPSEVCATARRLLGR